MICNAEKLNAELASVYSKIKSISISPKINKNISAPLLLKISDKWIESDERIVIIGQETFGWESGSIKNFDDFIACDEAIDTLMNGYEEFCFARKYRYRASPFWKAYREILKNPDGNPKFETNVIWTNIARIDYKNSSILATKEDDLSGIANQFIGILKEELQILSPTKIIFFTGPNYDSLLIREFPEVIFERFNENLSRKIIAKFSIGSAMAVRTYHPAYIQRTKRWEQLIGKICEEFI